MQAFAQRRALVRDPAILSLQRPANDLVPSSSRSSLTAVEASDGSKEEKGNNVTQQPDPFLVVFREGSPHNPQNWSLARKWLVTFLVTHTAIVVGAASSINSGAAVQAREKLNVSAEVMALDTALFLVGFGVASPLLGPLSELGGRSPVYLGTLVVFSLFEVGCALSPNFAARCVLRFLAGCAGSTPLANAGGTFADLWTSEERSFSFPVYTAGGFVGPVIGPLIGGFVGQSSLGYQWCDWISAIWGALALLVSFLWLPETYAPVLLKMKAEEIRKVTGDARYSTALERLRETVPFKQHFVTAVTRPWALLAQEPIVILFSAYLTVIYVILFGDLISFPIVFAPFNLSSGELGLTFLPILIGLVIVACSAPLILYFHRKEVARIHHLGHSVPPEERLRVAMVGTWLIPISLFWCAWTCYAKLTIWPVLASQIFLGIGIGCCFISSYQYIIDGYGHAAASALATITLTRYVMSGAAVMFTGPMFDRMGTHWALSFLGFVSLAASFTPFAFYFYGPTIRSWSRYACT